ncbi:alpha/beta hydrolase, partial [Aliarcobacter butzleri]
CEKTKEHCKKAPKGKLKPSSKRALSLVADKNQTDEDLIKTIIDMFDELGKETFISQLTSTLNRKDIFEKLINLDFPIWIYYSENDRLLNKEALEKINLLEDK